MSTHKHITIGGVHYDAHTGLRVQQHSTEPGAQDLVAAPKKVAPAHSVHKKAARTQTLSRSHVKAPTKQSRAAVRPVKKSPMVHKFAPHHANTQPSSTTKVINDIGPVKHPIQKKLEHRQQTPSRIQKATVPLTTKSTHATPVKHHPQPKPAQQIKQESIAKALHTPKPQVKKTSFLQRHPRVFNIASAGLAIVLLAGYLTYINLPNISVRVASVQAGISANYPSYQPSGYSLDGPVAFSDGKVSMRFAANVGPQSFTVNQAKSNWNSSALLENYVEQASSGEYETYSDNGLTIYTYADGAAWVNGGVLHTIDSDAALSGDQIRRIATSL